MNLECPSCKKSFQFYIKMNGPLHAAYCVACNTQFVNVSPNKGGLSEFLWPIGKHKGTKLGDLPDHYLKWAMENLEDGNLKKRVISYLEENKIMDRVLAWEPKGKF
jgi:uncharacterized protein (DUF3820 family)